MAAVIQPQRTLVPDAELMMRLVQRDSTALIELERRHRNSIYAQVYAILMDPAVSERVVTSVFAQLWNGAAWFSGKQTAWDLLRQMAADYARAERATNISRGARRFP